MSKLRINELESLETGRSLKVDEMAQTFNYEAGVKITSYNQMVRDSNGEFWRVSGQVALPYVTTGGDIPEGGAFVPAGDVALRQDLANPDKGAAMVARAVIYAGSVGEVESKSLPVGTAVFLTEEGRAGEFVVKTGTPPSDPLKGIYIPLDNGNYAERLHSGEIDVGWFGAALDGVTDDTAAISAAAAFGDVVCFGNTVLSNFTWPANTLLRGTGAVLDTFSNLSGNLKDASDFDNGSLKAVYVHDVYSVGEMLAIKAKGFNTIIHYLQFNTVTANAKNALDAAYAVGLKVILGSFSDTPTVTSFDDHPATLGYYLFDEPLLKGVTKAEQETRISAHRAVTRKILTMADFGVSGYVTKDLSPNFDIIFFDRYYFDQDDDPTNKLNTVRAWFEFSFKAPTTKVIPAVGLFTGTDYNNKSKALTFAKSMMRFSNDNGDFAAFSWDSSRSDSNVLGIIDEPDFQELARELTKLPITGTFKSKVLLLGGMYNNTSNSNLGGLIRHYLPHFSNDDAFPFSTQNVGSNTNLRETTFAYSGAAFRNSGGILATSFQSLGCITYNLRFRNFLDTSSITVNVLSSQDDFYLTTTEVSKILSATEGMSGHVYPEVMRVIGIEGTPSSSSGTPWKFLRGYLISHNWIEPL